MAAPSCNLAPVAPVESALSLLKKRSYKHCCHVYKLSFLHAVLLQVYHRLYMLVPRLSRSLAHELVNKVVRANYFKGCKTSNLTPQVQVLRSCACHINTCM